MRARARTFTIVIWLFAFALTSAGTAVLALSASAIGSTITQTSGTSFTTDLAASATYTDQIQTSGGVGTVMFSPGSSTPPGVTVDASGDVSTTGALSVGTYAASGVDSDTSLDAGTWTYTLTVSDTITQSAPSTGSTTTTASSGFTDTINVSNPTGVSFQTTAQSPALTVSSSGAITTTGSLSAGSYTVSGIDSDTAGDSGTWTYTLDVSTPGGGGGGGGGPPPTTLAQTSPTSAVSTPSSSSTFSSLLAVSGSSEAVTYTATSISSGLTFSAGTIATSGTLALGKYVASGTDRDVAGDSGTWTFTLTVTAGVLTQTSPTSATTTAPASKTFVPGRIAVANASGAVTFVTTTTSPALKVNPGGIIATTKALGAGKYHVAGSDSDTSGDAGTWLYTLTVTAPVTHVTFKANGGTGTMAVQGANAPHALTLDHFTRKKYSFAGWNTTANGRGTRFKNGAIYPFTSSVTLYAQWKRGPAASHTVTFAANDGAGTMGPESSSKPKALTPNSFTRAGYVFARWSTAPNGTGATYTNGAIYPFTSSVALYAQWKARPPTGHTVTFAANGGTGSMPSEKSAGIKTLSLNHFTRAGYRFVSWNTAPNGVATTYPNGAKFSFATSITLYAQWKKIVIPSTDATVTIGTFATKSSALTSSLESQISALASTAATDHDTTISLAGYGDQLSRADQLNESLWAADYALSQRRASAVAAYLRERLAAAGLTGVIVTSKGNGSPVSSSHAPASTKFRLVIASLT